MGLSCCRLSDLSLSSKITETSSSRYSKYLLLSRDGPRRRTPAGTVRLPAGRPGLALGAPPRGAPRRARRRDDPRHPEARRRRRHGRHRRRGRHVQDGHLPSLRRQGRPLPRRRGAHRRPRRRATSGAALSRSSTPPADTRELVASTVEAYLALVESDTEVYRFVVNRPLVDRPLADDPVGGTVDQVTDQLTGLLLESLRASTTDPSRARTWAIALVGSVRAVADDWLATPEGDRAPRAAVVDSLTELAWHGLAPVLATTSTPPPTPPRPARPPEVRPEGTEMSTAAEAPTTPAPTPTSSLEQVEHLDPVEPADAPDGRSLTAALRAHLDGPFGEVRDHCRALDPATFGPPSAPAPDGRAPVPGHLPAQRPGRGSRMPRRGFPEHQGGTARYGEAVAAFEMLGHSDLSLFVKAGVQWGLFGGAVSLLGTSRHDHLVPRLISGELQGCFAMTETGHGSDVQSLLTTATFDPATDEIVVHSPVPAARKDYIGNAARDARLAAVFAQLVVDGESRGVHCVLVPIRDERRRSRAGGHHRGLRSQARPRRRRQRAPALRPRPGPPHQPPRPLRRHRRRRHLLEPHRQPRPPLLHDARHARPGPHLGGRRRGRRGPLGPRRHDDVCRRAPSVRRPRHATWRRPSWTTAPTSGGCCRGSRRHTPSSSPSTSSSRRWTTCSPGARPPSRTSASSRRGPPASRC